MISCKAVSQTSISISRRFSTLQSLIGKPRDSYYFRCGTKPLIATTIGKLIDVAPERFDNDLVVIDCQQSVRKTFSELKDESTTLARGLLALNLKKGDRLAIWGPNRYEWLLTLAAAAKAGLILVTINPFYQADELNYCLNKVGVKTIVFPEHHLTQDYYKIISSLAPEIADSKPGLIKTKKYPQLQSLIVMTDKTLPGTFKLNDVMNAAGSNEIKALEIIQKNAGIDDDVSIMFTSGTTAKPKAVVMSNFAMINVTDRYATMIGYYDKKHNICSQVQMFHIFGSVLSGYASIMAGSTIVFPSFGYNPTKNLQAIQQEKCTAIYGTPTMFIDLIRHPHFLKTDTSNVKLLVGGGARFTPELMRQLFMSFPNAKLYIAYATTESHGLGSASEVVQNVHDISKMDHVGQVADNVEFKVVDSNNKMVLMGENGEICCRGYNVMNGYWDDEEKTKETIKDGWYHTGDLGSINSEGYLRIVGRIKENIIRGGENISPSEIEDVLVTHPNVVDAQIIGVYDERLGEDVCAWVKLAENTSVTEQDIKIFCKGKLAHYKIPKYIRFVNSFPLTRSGKVQKHLMVEETNRILSASSIL